MDGVIRIVRYVTADGTDAFDTLFRLQSAENRARVCEGPTDRRSGMPVRAHEASECLQTPEDVAAYLNAAIEESDGDPRLLMKAFRNVAAAQGGVSAIARKADVDRVALSRGLSGNRDPRLGTVTKIAAACGVSLRFVQREATK